MGKHELLDCTASLAQRLIGRGVNKYSPDRHGLSANTCPKSRTKPAGTSSVAACSSPAALPPPKAPDFLDKILARGCAGCCATVGFLGNPGRRTLPSCMMRGVPVTLTWTGIFFTGRSPTCSIAQFFQNSPQLQAGLCLVNDPPGGSSPWLGVSPMAIPFPPTTYGTAADSICNGTIASPYLQAHSTTDIQAEKKSEICVSAIYMGASQGGSLERIQAET
ncbi:MAG: hypothetical protein FRX49_06803 [Trebouxia sp. A1-2]|nr:MAG: hypothetical protein FRX49_06803 [Trebouxia sp. A1-2]